MADEYEKLNKVLAKLSPRQLIRFGYVEEGNGELREIIAEYSKHDANTKMVYVGRIFIPQLFHMDVLEGSTKIHTIRFVEYREIKGLERLVPEKLF